MLTDEAALIARCQRGDATAQRLIYESLADAVMPVCLRYIRQREEAEDALITVFFKAFRNIKSYEYRGRGSLEAWLRRITVTECLMRLRAGRRLGITPEEPLAEEETGEDIFSALAAKDLFRLIATLPDGYRTVFNLYAVEGYTHREIAALLNITEGSSKSQYSRAKAALRATLQSSGQTPKHYANR